MGEKSKLKRSNPQLNKNIKLGCSAVVLLFIICFVWSMLRHSREESAEKSEVPSPINVRIQDGREAVKNGIDSSSESFYSEVLRLGKLKNLFSRQEKVYADSLNTKVKELVRKSHYTGFYVHSNRGQLLCGLRTSKVLIIVMTNYNDIVLRATIRKTWGQQMKWLESQYGKHELQWRRVFVVSTADQNYENNALLQMELNMKPDMLQIEIQEHETKRALKLYSTLMWALNNCNFEYLLVTFGENFVNLRALYEFLHYKSKPTKSLYAGTTTTREVEVPKLPLSEHRGETVTKKLTYITDSSIIFSYDAILSIINKLTLYSNVPAINPDVMIGEVMDHLNIKPFDLKNFQTIAHCKYHRDYILQYETNRKCYTSMYQEYLKETRLRS